MMTKRFTYEYDEYNGNLFDNEHNTFYPIEDSGENIHLLCIRLNKIVDENEQLKSDLDYFKAKNGSLETGMFNLEREKEQLKKELSDDFNQSNCITVQKSIISDLKKENEQLKQLLLQFYTEDEINAELI